MIQEHNTHKKSIRENVRQENLKLQNIEDIVIQALEDKKAKNIQKIGIQHLSVLADSFIICTGTSSTHIKALADEVDRKCHEVGIGLKSKSGLATAQWVLLDLGHVILHIFDEESRHFYDLERLWADGEVQIINSVTTSA